MHLLLLYCRCIITYTSSTEKEDFYGEGADAKVPSLAGVTLSDIFDPLLRGHDGKGLLNDFRDPVEGSSGTEVPIEEKEEVEAPKLPRYEGWTPHEMISTR